jgi:histidinol-phosphatase (PHP family)
MKLISDYHNHPLGHDPNRKYSLELLNEWADFARQRGLKDVALTDHDRYHEGVNFENFFRFRESLLDGLKFRIGIELDNDPETSALGHKWTEKNYDTLDFVLGSVHFIDDWAFDHPSFKEEYKNWDINKLYEVYFTKIQETAKAGLIDGLAHLDLIKIFGYRPNKDIGQLIDETLSVIKAQDLTVEISTAGFRKPVGEIYPSEEIIAKIKKLNIPITIASDAHAPNHLAEDYDKLGEILSKYDFKEVAVFENHKRIMIPLN